MNIFDLSILTLPEELTTVLADNENEETIAMSKGDTLLIKLHERHRVSYTSIEQPCVWLCVFY